MFKTLDDLTSLHASAHFLNRDCNKGFVEVTGSEVNRGAGYGLEIPCIYRLYGPKPYTERNSEFFASKWTTYCAIIFQLRPQKPRPLSVIGGALL